MPDADDSEKRSYPYLASGVWWSVRKRFQMSVPSNVDASYLATVLGVGEKSAKNYIGQMRLIGLIDAQGKPTPLALKWRLDDSYAEACAEIRQRLYPTSLFDAVPKPSEEKDRAKAWFMQQGTGQATAGIQARFLALVDNPDLSKSEDKNGPSGEQNRTGTPAKKATAKKAAERLMTSPPIVDKGQATDPEVRRDRNRSTPALHIDLQIHIAADASIEQIDAIFASMAKHLYAR